MTPPTATAPARPTALPGASRGASYPDRRRQQPAPVRPGTQAPPLRVVRQRRSSRLHVGSVGLIAGALLFAALFGLVAFQTVLIGGQAQIDALTRQVREQEDVNKALVVDAADLRAPSRILEAAREHLGMVEPATTAFIATDGELLSAAAPEGPGTSGTTNPSSSSGGPAGPATSAGR